uniref:Putative arabinose 5-phosphate isomerase-like n=1 Tax=Tetraselmis sp. GSL018 TaxID=582737 RepID=A0A061RIT8_9CHLO
MPPTVAETITAGSSPAPGLAKPPKPLFNRRGSRGLSNCDADGLPLPVDTTKLDVCSIRQLFDEQRSSVDYFWDNIDHEKVRQFTEACVECQGVICFTGVGKSGLIAHKISQTLVSTGTKSVFLSPTDALHGDIGILSEKDLLVILFKKGDSDELLSERSQARMRIDLR